MIAKISTGQGFAGAVRYVLDEREKLSEDRQPALIGGNMAGQDSRELAREFHAVRQLRPDVEKPVYHVSLSFPRNERPLGDEEMARLASDYLKRRGFDPERCQYVVARHRDRPHPHCHILVNRIRTDGTLVPLPHREYIQNKEVCRQIETDYKLRAVTSERRRGRGGLEERAPSRGEDRMKRDRGMSSEKDELRRLIREASKDRPTMTVFLRRLERSGVQARPNVAKTGHVSGISYRLDHVAVKGSQLGRAYTWEGLQKQQGVVLDHDRDRPAIDRAVRATEGQEPARAPRPKRSRPSRLAGKAARKLAGRIPGVSRATAILRVGQTIAELVRKPSARHAAAAVVRTTALAVPRVDRLMGLLSKLRATTTTGGGGSGWLEARGRRLPLRRRLGRAPRLRRAVQGARRGPRPRVSRSAGADPGEHERPPRDGGREAGAVTETG